MATTDGVFLPSVLDRLLEDPSAPGVRQRSRAQQLLELRNSVRRDLEALLNTHHPWRTPPPEMTELRDSLLEYGIPDFLTANAGSPAAREEFRRAVEDTIRRFEPRFKIVKVSLPEEGITEDRSLHFHIDALMFAEPAPERVSFDSVLDPSSNIFSVVGGRDG